MRFKYQNMECTILGMRVCKPMRFKFLTSDPERYSWRKSTKMQCCGAHTGFRLQRHGMVSRYGPLPAER